MATTNESYELVNLGPEASGWRAVFSGGGGAYVPLVAWGIFHKTQRQATGEVTEDLGNVMEGLIARINPAAPDLGGPVREFYCAAESADFEGYLPPET